MLNERSQNRKPLYGGLIVLAFITVAALIFSIQWLFRAATPSVQLIALLPEAVALDANTPVWIAGQEVGTVKTITFRGAQTDSATRLAVALEIPRKYLNQVRRDAHVRLTSARLVGEPVVDIEPGSPSAPAMRAGDTLRVSQSGTLEGVMDKAQSLTLDFDKLVLDMQSFQNGAQRGSERLARLQNNLMAVSGEFRDFSRSLTDSPAHDASTRVQAALKHMQAQNQQLRVALHDAMQRAQSTRADVQPALHRLMARSDTISQLIASLRQQMTQGGGGLLVRAQKDSAIVKALHEATRQLDSLMTETKRNPLRFWF